MRRISLFAPLFALLVIGCSRSYVASPESARDNNDLDWTIRSTPSPPIDAPVDAPDAGNADSNDAPLDSEEISP